MFLLLGEFALNSTRFVSTKQLPVIVVFSHETNLPLEIVVRDVTDFQV